MHHIGKGPDTAHVPKDTIHHTPQRVLAFHDAFNRGKSQSVVESKVGLYDHSPHWRQTPALWERQEVAAKLRELKTTGQMQIFFFRTLALCVAAAEREPEASYW